MRAASTRGGKSRQFKGTEKPAANAELPPALGEDEVESDEGIDASALVDQGDGVRVRRGPRRVSEEERSYECPDEPPPGWGGDS